jgi:CzcA family heavy metal efflux pump
MKKTYYSTYKSPISIILLLIISGGVLIYANMKKSLFPEITFPKVKIVVDDGLQPVNKMMITVTKPLENAIKQVPDLEYVRSTTSRGSCEISAFMNWDANIDIAKLNIESRINEVRNDLPAGAQITVEKMNPSILPVMDYAINSKTMSPIDLKILVNYTIKPFLSQVPGVADVQVVGGETKEYWVELDPQKMSALGITPNMISQAMQKTNFVLSNGYLSDYRRLYLTVTDALVKGKSQLENIVISNNGKRVILLKDITNVAIHPAIQYIRVNANGHESLLIGIRKQPNANLLDVAEGVRKQLQELKKTLPKSVTIKPFYVQADFVHDAIKSVSDALWIGILLAIIVAVAFLRSWKASLTILIIVPITLALTMITLYSIGYTLNIMTLGAAAASIGLIIDDAIVVVEQIHRTHEEHLNEPTGSLIHKAIHYLFPAMVASSLSTIVIFTPFAFLSGVAGAYFTVLANTMIITLVCSFIVTWLGLPVVYLLLSKKHPDKHEKTKVVKQRRWVGFFIRRPLLSLLFVAVLIGTIIIVLPKLGTGFLPEMDEGAIVLDYTTPPGTSLDETDRICRQVEKIIQQEPEVESYSRRTGTQMGFYITEPNTGDYLIELKKKRNRTTDEVIDDLRKKIESTQPALQIDFGQVISDMLGDLMESAQPIEIKIFGSDQATLNKLAEKVADEVDSVPGTADVFNGIVIAGPSINITPNMDKLAQFGMTPADLQFQLQTHLEGNVVGGVLEQQQVTPVRMIYPGALHASLDQVKNENVFLPDGQLTPISELANVQIQKGAAEIQRENLQNMSVVTARLNNRSLGAVMNDIKKKLSGTISLPQGYSIVYSGQYQEQQQSFHELLIILITASLLVFIVMLFFSRDILVSLSILSIAILGMAGSILALYFTHTELNVGSYTGIIMIVGIIGENSIFTFLQFNESLKEIGVDESLIYSISTRLRPKLMTAIGAIIALMPLALGIGTGAQLHQPLAIAVIGGFLMALPLLLIVLPSMIRLIYQRKATNKHLPAV